jgi:hypothetical protein
MKTCDLLRLSRALASSTALCVLLASAPAHAQAQDQAAARALFEDGRRLLKEGKYPEACRTLEAASKLYPSPGILLNLGDCFEKVGRTASAWTEFGEAASVAARALRNDQVAEAKRRQSAVEPKLAKLTIRVPNVATGVTIAITRDETELSSVAWGEAIPVDPGPHRIRAEAPGHEPWTTTVVVTSPGQTVTVDVPVLTASPTPPAPVPVHEAEANQNTVPEATSPATTAPVHRKSTAVDWALIGGGVVVGVVGGVLWDLGADHAREASGPHPQSELDSARSSYSSAKTLYIVGLGGVVVGGAAAVTGLILMTVGRGGKSHTSTIGAMHASPWVSPAGGGLVLAGGF